MVVDLFAHDGWVPLACLQLHIENHSIACGSVAHTEIEHKFTKERVSSIIFVPVCVCVLEAYSGLDNNLEICEGGAPP